MAERWVISDTHFNHAGIIHLAKRPFKSVSQMNEAMTDNWNEHVKPDDYVLHLGDVIWEEQDPYKNLGVLHNLHGKKHLLVGNHDKFFMNPLYNRAFTSIALWLKDKSTKTIFTHVPMSNDTWEMKEAGFVNVHGHIHDRASPSDSHRNACVEWLNYTPIPYDEIVRR